MIKDQVAKGLMKMIVRKPKWILASASPRRRDILARLGLNPVIDPCGTPEPLQYPGESPADYARRAARHKSRDVARRHRSGIVIGADTVVVVGNTSLGKPESEEDARLMLGTLAGRPHEVITGICLTDSARGRYRSAHCRSKVYFRRLATREIDWYIKMGEYSDKAGAYAIQGYASLFVDRIEGDYFNIVGFPLSTFARMCRCMGVNLYQA
jgi:septum formation protein